MALGVSCPLSEVFLPRRLIVGAAEDDPKETFGLIPQCRRVEQ